MKLKGAYVSPGSLKVSAAFQWVRNSSPLMPESSVAETQAQTDCLCITAVVLVMQCPRADLCCMLSQCKHLQFTKANIALTVWGEHFTTLPECLPAKLGQVLEYYCVTAVSGVGLSNYVHSYYSSGKIHVASVSGTEIVSLSTPP